MEAKEVIDYLGLVPHPEGGFFKRVFCSENKSGDGNFLMSSIYYLLEKDDFSAFHRLGSVEVWFFHIGEPISIYLLNKDGSLETHSLSSQIGDKFQLAIEPNTWFAADIPSKKGFALLSCAVSPEFSFTNFELAKKEDLIKEFPQHKSIISHLTR
jgi:predicted cupin superfamily sugar epimerase